MKNCQLVKAPNNRIQYHKWTNGWMDGYGFMASYAHKQIKKLEIY